LIKKDINPAASKKFKYIESVKMSSVKSDIEIARAAKMKPIKDVLAKLSVPDEPSTYSPIGRHIAKLNLEYIDKLKEKNSNLILISAITPTPAGEGKTTTSVGLCDGLNKIGKKSVVCLREPSLGPSFGMKGGAAGGGYAQVIPMEKINLHFTGDFHAITSAHNLLSALIDNHIYWGNKLNIDVRRIVWRRVVDLNDRSLRSININLGGIANGFPREDGFDITVASEVMAIFCLSNNLKDLEEKIGNIFYSIIAVLVACALMYGINGVDYQDRNLSFFADDIQEYGYLKTFGNLFYFSVVVFSTVGFGEITPLGLLNKTVMIFEGLTGGIITTIFIIAIYRKLLDR